MVFRRSIRALAATPGSTVAAILTLALGVAASTCVFTLVNALLLRPLPFADPERLAAISSTPRGGVSWQDLRDLTESVESLEAAAVYSSRTWGYTAAPGRPPEVVLSGMVTGDFFRVLGVAPTLGEPFDTALEQRGANRVLWLTHEFWLRHYRGDRSIAGRTAWLNDVPHRIAGVLPAGFRFPMRAGTPEIYIPLDIAVYCCSRDNRGSEAIARWKPGAPRGDLRAASLRLAEQFPATNRDVEFTAEDLQSALAATPRKPLLLLAAGVAVLMIVAALNAAGILLARAASRAREAAIRSSLGAGLPQLTAEQAAQGIAIGLAAAALGFFAAVSILDAARSVPALADSLAAYTRIHPLEPDWRVALFCLLTAVLAATAAAVAPVLLLARQSIEATLRAAAGSSSSPAAVRWRNALVALQVACTVVLLGAGGMLLHSLWNLVHVDPGFRVEHIVSAGIGIPEARYDTDEKMIAFHQQAIENLQAIPGVRGAAGGAGLPVGPMSTRILLAGESIPLAERPRVDAAVASPGLPALLGIPLLAGRTFDVRDRWGAPRTLLVNHAFAARFFPGGQPLGARLRLSFYNGFAMKPWSEFEIVGVIGDTRSRSAERAPEPMVVLCSAQIAMEGFVYYTASTRDPASLRSEFRQAIWNVDPNIQAVRPVTLEQRRSSGLDERKLNLWLLGSFAALALLLAGAGLGAATAATVAETRREIGIRSALGATPAAIATRVVRSAARAAAAGLALGIVGLAATARLLRSQLFGVGPLDPAALAGVVLLISAVVAAACAFPAWRAARLDPAQVLRAN